MAPGVWREGGLAEVRTGAGMNDKMAGDEAKWA